MEVNITTVTANRKTWGKALFRIQPQLTQLQHSIKELSLKDEYCEVLQIIFQDEGTTKCEPDGFVEADKKEPKDTVKQVSMIVPSGFTFKKEEDELLYEAVLNRSIAAIGRSFLNKENKDKIIEIITAAR